MSCPSASLAPVEVIPAAPTAAMSSADEVIAAVAADKDAETDEENDDEVNFLFL